MQVTKDKVVSFDFRVTDENGQLLDTSEGQRPFPYIHGNGYLVPGLEDAMEGKYPQDSFSVSVPPSRGYGERDDEKIQTIPRERFEGLDLRIGMNLEARYADGPRILTVVAIDDDHVTLDGNHPLAGKTMDFDVTIVEVRDATPEELKYGHPFAATDCGSGSGCGCGCKEDGCDDGCEGGHCH